MRNYIRLMGAVAFVTSAVFLAPILPVPINFWAALAASLLGPGLGATRILFPRKLLTLPESLVITILVSLFVNAALFSILNSLSIQLTRAVISVVLLSTTCISVLGALLRERLYIYPDEHIITDQSQISWVSFFGGVILAATVTISALLLIRF